MRLKKCLRQKLNKMIDSQGKPIMLVQKMIIEQQTPISFAKAEAMSDQAARETKRINRQKITSDTSNLTISPVLSSYEAIGGGLPPLFSLIQESQVTANTWATPLCEADDSSDNERRKGEGNVEFTELPIRYLQQDMTLSSRNDDFLAIKMKTSHLKMKKHIMQFLFLF